MAHHYANNPIIEAVFEFAPRGGRWLDQTKRQIEQELVGVYSGKREDAVAGISFSFNTTPAGTQINFAQPPPARRRLWSPDGRRMVQFAADLCAFNALRPYTHYVDYVPAMEQLLKPYTGRTKPAGVAFLGQRYINEILLPGIESDPSEFFVAYPKMPGLASKHPPFAVQLQVEEILHGKTVLSLAFRGFDAAQRPRYTLELYVRTPDHPPIPFEWGQLKAWQDQAHESITRVFEGALRAPCEELLGKGIG